MAIHETLQDTKAQRECCILDIYTQFRGIHAGLLPNFIRLGLDLYARCSIAHLSVERAVLKKEERCSENRMMTGYSLPCVRNLVITRKA